MNKTSISAITTIKDGTVTFTLPREIRKSWKDAEVFVDFNSDIVSIKRLSKPSLNLKEMMNEFLEAAKKTRLSKKEVNQALKEIRINNKVGL